MHQCIDFQDFNGIIYCVKIVSKGTPFETIFYAQFYIHVTFCRT